MIFLRNGVHLGTNATLMSGLVNHSHQANPYIEFFHFIGKIAPASYGILYLRDDEGTSNRNPNRFFVLRMARGQVEELEDTLLSPCVPLIEDDEA